jgi:multisubunit Na+/H+ antiporter MnhG subunit
MCPAGAFGEYHGAIVLLFKEGSIGNCSGGPLFALVPTYTAPIMMHLLTKAAGREGDRWL